MAFKSGIVEEMGPDSDKIFRMMRYDNIREFSVKNNNIKHTWTCN